MQYSLLPHPHVQGHFNLQPDACFTLPTPQKRTQPYFTPILRDNILHVSAAPPGLDPVSGLFRGFPLVTPGY
jgi:hypothetical protein